MKLYITGLALTQVLFFSAAMAGHQYVDPYALEPSINGGVSAGGLFPSQAEEDAYLADQLAMELEPCINGDVSSSGLFASQAEEDAFTGAIAAN